MELENPQVAGHHLILKVLLKIELTIIFHLLQMVILEKILLRRKKKVSSMVISHANLMIYALLE